MSKASHDIRSNHGKTIYMPEYYHGEEGFGNLAIPNIYAADDAVALYPRGTRLVQGERSFYYGKYLGKLHNAGTSIDATSPGVDIAGKFCFHNTIQTDMTTGLLVRMIAGEDTMWYNGILPAGARSNDFYSGGWITGKDASANSPRRMFWRYIERHRYWATGADAADLLTGASAYTHLSGMVLDQPVTNSKNTMATTLMQNPWKRIVWQEATAYAMSRGKVAGACMHNDPAMNGHCWFQTHGPMACMHLEYTLGTIGGETLMLMADGSISPRGASYDRLLEDYSIVGYLLSDPFYASGSSTTELLPMIFVTIQR